MKKYKFYKFDIHNLDRFTDFIDTRVKLIDMVLEKARPIIIEDDKDYYVDSAYLSEDEILDYLHEEWDWETSKELFQELLTFDVIKEKEEK